MDEWLCHLKERRAHWAKMVVLIRQGRIGPAENLQDIRPRLIQQLERLIESLDELIAGIEQLIANRSNRQS